MTMLDTIKTIEDQAFEIEQARAVLRAAIEETETGVENRIYRGEHILCLLRASDHIFCDIQLELNKIADAV